MYLQSQPFDPLPIHDINIYSAERDFYSIIERICNDMHIFLTVIFKDNARLAWYDFCLCIKYKSNVRYRCLFQTLLLIFLKWKINDKERRNRDEGHFFRRNYMHIIWFFLKNCFHWHIYWRNLIEHWYSVTSIHSCWHYKNKFQKLYTFSLTWKAMIEQFKDSTNGPIEIIVVAIHYKHLKIGQI